MDVPKLIKELTVERERLDQAIAVLESLAVQEPPVKRRGRTGMAPAERAEVSTRMKRYWEKRKNGSRRS
ncbi:MAG: hypothetical protein FJW39_07275 [Acidobacteria bacterium]|nr:hypothetical protein [Acidobacteriota bacterium]